MPPLPILKPRQVTKALRRAGFYLDHQTGSHAQFLHKTNPQLRVTVPIHNKDVKRGTLKNIIRQSGMSVDDFLKLLSQTSIMGVRVSSCYKKFVYALLFCAIFTEISFAQEKNPTTWPYGGVPDSSRYKDGMDRVPLNFARAKFDSLSIKNGMYFSYALFDCFAYYRKVEFQKASNFEHADFAYQVDFSNSGFENGAQFSNATFRSNANFYYTTFAKEANFIRASFEDEAIFEKAIFHDDASFYGNTDGKTEFKSRAVFQNTVFANNANFYRMIFYKKADFHKATFKKGADFSGTIFANTADFRDAEIIGSIDFSLAIAKDSVLVGTLHSDKIQSYDFSRAKLLVAGSDFTLVETTRSIPTRRMNYPGAKIILFGPVDLKMQMEKLAFVELYDTLDYFSKKDIITVLKEQSFKIDKDAQFELDYLFAKSVMYQKISVEYEPYSKNDFEVIKNKIYELTMGQGFQPFQLAYIAGIFIFIFAELYWTFMPKQINGYIATYVHPHDSEKPFGGRKIENISKLESILNCIYFSTMVLFTFRFKGGILTHFGIREKIVIGLQWLLGFSIYFAFLRFSKSGSILQNLKDLFIG